jgi:Fe-S cluster biogenesis protein NfuA
MVGGCLYAGLGGACPGCTCWQQVLETYCKKSLAADLRVWDGFR